MIALRAALNIGMFALLFTAAGCACCQMKKPCGDSIDCCDSVSGCDMACKYYDGCCKSDIPVCVCTGPSCCCEPSCGCCAEPDCCCEPECCCEPGCSCEPDCCCEPACGCDACCEPCGCGDCCGCGKKCFAEVCVLAWLKGMKTRMGQALGGCCGCAGCDGEVYWNEWHNDPPRCCDPCDKCGNWIGPSTAYRAPYDHPYCK